MCKKILTLIAVMGFVLFICAPLVGVFGVTIGSIIAVLLLAYLSEK
jgi:hypothetical protein|nr:MAG TPA: hypothetical protein [Caudoviricetes sp.]